MSNFSYLIFFSYLKTRKEKEKDNYRKIKKNVRLEEEIKRGEMDSLLLGQWESHLDFNVFYERKR